MGKRRLEDSKRRLACCQHVPKLNGLALCFPRSGSGPWSAEVRDLLERSIEAPPVTDVKRAESRWSREQALSHCRSDSDCGD